MPGTLSSPAGSTVLVSSLVEVVQDRQTLPARHRLAIVGGDILHLSTMSSLPIAWVAQNHAVIIEGMSVTLLSFISGHESHHTFALGFVILHMVTLL
jgi:hypothetical protein